MKRKKVLSALFSAALLLSGCASNNTAVNTDGTTKPKLKVLMDYQTFDPATDSAAKRIMEKTGYNVEYFLLPNRNASEKLMMEIASGNEYDILRLSNSQFGQLSGQGALMELDDLLNAHAPNIKSIVDDMAWKAASANGKIYAIPYSSGNDVNDPKGIMMGGLGVRTDVLEELGISLPGSVDDFYEFLKKIRDAKGIEPLTVAVPYVDVISSAFGISNAEWYEVDGKCIPRVKMPQTMEYITFMSKLYKEGLLDKDFPINKDETTLQKLANGKAAVMKMMFWDVPSALPAVQKNNPAANIDFITPLSGKDGKPYISLKKGIDKYEALPKTSQNAVDAMKFSDLRAKRDIFISTFIGDEGVHHEHRDGEYYPILPAFDELTNANQFTGVGPKDFFKMWQARARKTPDMAKAYEKMNENVDKETTHVNLFDYANGLPTVQKYRLSLLKLERKGTTVTIRIKGGR